MSHPFIGESFALGAALCWAVGPLIAYRGVEALGTIRFSQSRYCISALILFILTACFGSFDGGNVRSISLLVLSGIIGTACGETALFQAVSLLGPRRASIIFSLHAPMTALLGAVLFSESISPSNFGGVVLSVIGVYTALIFRSTSEKTGGAWHKQGKFGKGVLFACAAVAFQIIGALLAKEVSATITPFFASFLRTSSAAIAFFPVFLLLRGHKSYNPAQTAELRFVLYSALVSTVGGMTLLLAAFASTEIFRAVIIASLSPILYILIMGMTRGERFPLGAWIGTITAVCGVVLTLT